MSARTNREARRWQPWQLPATARGTTRTVRLTEQGRQAIAELRERRPDLFRVAAVS